MERKRRFSEEKLLLFSVFILSLCGIIYELVLGSLATYLLGNPVQQYSITIGVFLSSMGIGSYLSRFLVKNILRDFIIIEIVLGFIGGLAVLVLSFVFSFSASFYLMHLFFLIIIGAMVGLEIPLLTRILRKYGALKDTISNVLTLDYMGGLAGSLLFPLLLFPFAGRILTGLIMGMVNIFISLLVIIRVDYPEKKRHHYFYPVLFAIILAVLIFKSDSITGILQKRLYYDDIVFSKRSKFQEIVLTRNGRDFRLYLDGSLQFSSVDEYRYHEMLVLPALYLNRGREREVAILGGGDGLAVREVLNARDIAGITLVELDGAMIELARYNSSISMLNGNSLHHNKVKIITGDAYEFLIKNRIKYDVIIADFPDPHDEAVSKLYSVEFFSLVRRSLKPSGIFVTQSTSPFSAREAFWCINATLKKVFKSVIPYHVYVPTFGDWGFNMASTEKPDIDNFNVPGEGLLFFTREEFINSLYFPRDSRGGNPEPEINTFNKPVLYSYYLKGWKHTDF